MDEERDLDPASTEAEEQSQQPSSPLEPSIVEREGDFLRFLLTARRGQALLLLRNITPRQTNAISEICKNILYSEDLDEDLLKSLKARTTVTLLRKIGEGQSSLNKRKSEIKLHPVAVLNIVKKVEDILPL